MKESINYVVQNSEYVCIDKRKIENILDDLTKQECQYWFDQDKVKLNEPERILLMFVVESLNYCFWEKPKFQIEYEGRIVNGIEAVFSCLLQAIAANKNFLKLDNLVKITKEEFLQLFEADCKLPLLGSRYDNFKDTIMSIEKLGLDNFYEKLFSIGSEIELLEFIVSNFKSFQDISVYKEKKIFFVKRAILLVIDLYHVSEQIRSNIKNLDGLMAGADYCVKKTPR